MKLEKTSTSSVGLVSSPETQKPRLATQDDIEFLVALGLKFIANSPYRDTHPDPNDVRVAATNLVANGIVYVTENGFIAGVVTPIFFAPSVLIATELAWWSEDGQGRALREAFEEHAKNLGVPLVQMSVLSTERASDIVHNLTTAGYSPIEVALVKAL